MRRVVTLTPKNTPDPEYLQPLSIHGRVLHFDQWVMLGAVVLLLLFLKTGRRMDRQEDGFLIAGYIVYAGISFTLFGR